MHVRHSTRPTSVFTATTTGTFVNRGAVALPNLPKLIDAAHAAVGQYEGARLQHPLAIVLDLHPKKSPSSVRVCMWFGIDGMTRRGTTATTT
jgi:hypothetical protein